MPRIAPIQKANSFLLRCFGTPRPPLVLVQEALGEDAGDQEKEACGEEKVPKRLTTQRSNLQTKRKVETESTLSADPTEVMGKAKRRAGRWCVPPPLGWMKQQARRG